MANSTIHTRDVSSHAVRDVCNGQTDDWTIVCMWLTDTPKCAMLKYSNFYGKFQHFLYYRPFGDIPQRCLYFNMAHQNVVVSDIHTTVDPDTNLSLSHQRSQAGWSGECHRCYLKTHNNGIAMIRCFAQSLVSSGHVFRAISSTAATTTVISTETYTNTTTDLTTALTVSLTIV